jgi:DNA-binding IclR family transcriptional regulator
MSTTARTMRRILALMPQEPTPIKDLAAKTRIPESNLRNYLRDMESLGIVERKCLDGGPDRCSVGWARAHRPSM